MVIEINDYFIKEFHGEKMFLHCPQVAGSLVPASPVRGWREKIS